MKNYANMKNTFVRNLKTGTNWFNLGQGTAYQKPALFRQNQGSWNVCKVEFFVSCNGHKNCVDKFLDMKSLNKKYDVGFNLGFLLLY